MDLSSSAPTQTTSTNTATGASQDGGMDAFDQAAKNVSKKAANISKGPGAGSGKSPQDTGVGAKPAENKEEQSGKTFKLTKIDGTEYEVPERDYHEAARKGLTADKRMYEANLLKKQAIEEKRVLAEMKQALESESGKSPIERFKDLLKGLKDENISKDFRKEAELWLYEQIQRDEEPEHEKRIRAAEERARLAEEKANAEENRKKQEAEAVKKNQYRKAAEESVIKGVQASGLPVTEYTVKRFADLKYNASKAGADVSDEQLASFLKTDTIENNKALFGSYVDQIIKARESKDNDAILKAGEAMSSQLPENFLQALRIFDYINHIQKTNGQMSGAPIDTPKAQKEPEAKKELSWSEYQEERKRKAEELQKSWKRSS